MCTYIRTLEVAPSSVLEGVRYMELAGALVDVQEVKHDIHDHHTPKITGKLA